MKRLSYTLSTLALAVASPAVADTSAAELWAEWQAQTTMMGQTITADATETDTGLLLSNVVTSFEDAATSTASRGEIAQIELIENADGTVNVTMSTPYSMTQTFPLGPNEPPANIEILVSYNDLDMVVSGEAGARTYTYSASSVTVADGELSGGNGEPPDMDIQVTATDVAATYSITGTDADSTQFTTSSTLGGITASVEVTPAPPSQGSLKVGFMIGASESSSSGALASLAPPTAGEAYDLDGLELSIAMAYDAYAMELAFEEPTEAFTVLYSNDGGNIGFDLSEDAMDYAIAASGASAMVTGSELPVPVEISVGSSEIAFSLPLAASDAPQDMGLRLSVQDLIVGESLLGMVDPGQAIPRDPASLLLDATGQVQLFMDLMTLDPETMTGPPGELRALSVTDLNLSVGGAELSGTADLTFAPNQLIPMPVGQADLELSGGNTLMQALVAGGMVPAAQSGMIMGMANVFARPGAGPDTLETTVEFGANGSITANGIPLQ